jgi:hypothetical protein
MSGDFRSHLSQSARQGDKTASKELADAARAGDAVRFRAAAIKLNASCNDCHTTWRD